MAAPKCSRCLSLATELAELRAQNAQLRFQLKMLQKQQGVVIKNQSEETKENLSETLTYSPFSRMELQRFGRQMLVKEFGSKAQLKLRTASVLLIGVGGLGSPAAMYLAAMGVGTLVIVDGDHVDRSNLHRQIIHDEQGARDQEMKVDSAKKRLQQLNPLLHCKVHPIRFTAANALKLVAEHDVVVDASDNVGTRYLVNDVCARQRKPLVSGSALGLEGQVTVFTYQDNEDATGCYRCLYPTPPRVAMSCAENGVIGVVPGVIGCLQAMETVKIITGVGEPLVGVQCFYDAYDGQFRHLKIGKKNAECPSCGRHKGDSNTIPAEFSKVRKAALAAKGETHSSYVLLDTRTRTQFEMVHFPEAMNIPTAQLMKQEPAQVVTSLQNVTTDTTQNPPYTAKQTFVICRRGVDSVKVTRWLINNGIQNVVNVNGGYTEYAKEDPTFPMY
ncbi:Molybdenum cofactor synthesis protein [Phytophthora palmivora]|uniref:Molybdenum cofactor synthesis protein n=1 Tax=Phytophthora palmivora TaxID=4796 RepID=A0A2P4YEZ7_9STRA|nr:Molybdenum cofactor synthesis protein [Phytophthora palmivora]